MAKIYLKRMPHDEQNPCYSLRGDRCYFKDKDDAYCLLSGRWNCREIVFKEVKNYETIIQN